MVEFMEFLQGLIALTGGSTPFIGCGPSEKSGTYRFTREEVRQLRSLANYTLHDGAAIPTKDIRPVGTYLPSGEEDSMMAVQKCLIYSPIMVSEYLLGKRNDLWSPFADMDEEKKNELDDAAKKNMLEDTMETRRIISFYSREFYKAYNEILVKELI